MKNLLTRLGGMVVAPRQTIRAILNGEGRFEEILPLMIFGAVIYRQHEAKTAVAKMTAYLWPGLLEFFRLLATELLGEFLLIIIGAALFRFVLLRSKKIGWDALLTAVAYCYVPYFFLLLIGATLDRLGLAISVMPQATWGEFARANPSLFAIVVRYALSYLWPGICAVLIWKEGGAIAKESQS